MAKVRYYPTDDINVAHSKQPSDYEAKDCINEQTADDDTTYLYHQVTGTSNNSKTSVIMASRVYPPYISSITNGKDYIWISSVKVCVRAKITAANGTATISCILRDSPNSTGTTLASIPSSSLTTSYKDFSASSSSMAGVYYTDYMHENAAPYSYLSITTTGKKSSSKSSLFNIRITQAYVEYQVYNCWESTAVATAHTTASVNHQYFWEGGTVTFTATVDSGYDFVGWLDATNYQKYQQGQTYSVQSTSLTYSFAIQSDCTYYAVAKRPITVNAVATTGVSSATVEWSASDNAYKWQATVSSGYTFVGWMTSANYQAYQNGGNYSVLSTDLTYYYMPSSDTTLYAVARELLGSITIQVSNGGTISYRSDENDSWTTVTGPQTVTLTGHVDDEYDLKTNPINSQYHMASVTTGTTDQDQSVAITYDFDNYIVTEVYANASENDGIKKTVIDIPASKIRYYDENDELILEKATEEIGDSSPTAEDLDTIARMLQEGSPISVSKYPVVISIVYAIDSSALIPPVITVTSQDVLKISNKTSKTRCTVKFTADQNLTTFEARAQLTSSANWSGRNGVVVETGEPLDLGDEGWVYVDYNELPSGDGQYDIKIFGQNEGGVWSE